MKKLIYVAFAVLLTCGFSACTSYNYYKAAINKTNMSGYHTFAWMPPSKTGSKVGDMADIKIKDAATTALVAKGLQVSQRNPDLIVNYNRIVGTGSYTTYHSPYYGGFYPAFGYAGWGYGWGWGYGYRPYYAFGGPFDYYGGLTYAERGHYKEGTVIVDLIDARTRRIVWRGFGVGEVHHNQQKDIDDLPKVVNGILDQLNTQPPRPVNTRES